MRLEKELLTLRSSLVLARVLAPAFALVMALGSGCSSTSPTSEAPPADGGSGFETGGGSSSGSTSGSGSSGSSSGGSDTYDSGTGTTSDATVGGNAGSDAAAADASDGASLLSGPQVLIWIPTYLGSFSDNLNAVTSSNPKAFTQVSPDFYNLNYNYASGPAQIAGESYDGLSVAQVAQQVHAAGMQLIPLVYAGAGNSGTDQGIQNVISDSPAGTQNNFITAMVQEAQTRQYDGWNLDFEVGNTGYTQYGMDYVTFLTAFKAALNAQKMILTIDLGDWYIRQCGGDGLVDLTQIGPSVDLAIIEDYAGSLGQPLSSCPGGTPPSSQDCSNDFGALMNIMCDVSPTSAVSIGLIQGSGGSGANPFVPQAVNAVAALGFTSISVWPDDTPFLSSQNIPNGGTWYSSLAAYLSGQQAQ
jgi:hypothetical protein